MMTGGRSRHPATQTTLAPSAATEEDSDEDLAKAWKAFDPSLKSSITNAQFRQVMAGLGENVSDKEVDELIGSIDGEDKISCKWMIRLVFEPSAVFKVRARKEALLTNDW
jgi:Ca2+-binding EF-hand superfamily protein